MIVDHDRAGVGNLHPGQVEPQIGGLGFAAERNEYIVRVDSGGTAVDQILHSRRRRTARTHDRLYPNHTRLRDDVNPTIAQQ